MESRRIWNQHLVIRTLVEGNLFNTSVKIITTLRPEFFSSLCYRKAFSIIREHFGETGEIIPYRDLVTHPNLRESDALKIRTLERKRKKSFGDNENYKLPESSIGLRNLCESLQYDVKQREIINLNNDLAVLLQKDMPHEKIEEVIERVRETLERVDSLRLDRGKLFKATYESLKQKIKDLYKMMRDNYYIPTGFKEFDTINIGIPATALFTIAAPTGCGKSSLCLQYLMNAVNAGAKVCLLPLEMSEEEMVLKIASNLLEIPPNDLMRTLKDVFPEIRKAFKEWIENTDGEFHMYTPDINETLPDVLMKLRSEHYDIIAVDYINLLAGMKEEKWAALDEAGIYAKRYAGKYKTQIVFLAQLDKYTGDTRYSKAIMEHSCLTGDALIETPQGSIPLAKLGKEFLDKPKGFYPLNKRIINFDGKSEMATHFYVNGEAPIIRITTSDGKQIKGTENHKLYVRTHLGNYKWKALKDLRVGDKLRIGKVDNYIPRPLEPDYDKARLLSFAVSGHIKDDLIVDVPPTTGEMIDFYIYKKYVSYLLDDDGNRIKTKLKIKNKRLLKYLSQDNKTLLSKVCKFPKEEIYSFIRCVFETDQLKKKDNKYIFTPYDKELLPYYSLIFDKVIPVFKQVDESLVATNNELYAFVRKLGLSGFICYLPPEKISKKYKSKEYVTITQIDELPPEPTYDLAVKSSHSYIANGIVSHNSNMWTWNHTPQDILENKRIEITQPKARGQNPKPFVLYANLACSLFKDYIEDMEHYVKQKGEELDKLRKKIHREAENREENRKKAQKLLEELPSLNDYFDPDGQDTPYEEDFEKPERDESEFAEDDAAGYD